MHERIAALWRMRIAGFPAPDLALAIIMLVIAVLSTATGNPAEGPLAVTLPVAVVAPLSLAWRVRSPFVAVGILVVSGLTQSLLAEVPGSLWSLVLYAIVMYSTASTYPEGRAALAGVILVAELIIEERIDNGVDYLFVVVLFGGLWLLGRASRLWRTRVSHAEQRERDTARLAVAEERVRIARELHDIVAHSLSVISVQSDAAEAALAARPELARAPLHAIRSTARDSLGEIRQLLQALRDDDDPVPSAFGRATLDELVATAASAGLPVVLRADASDTLLPAPLEAAVYRIVQEALTNVIKHAGLVATTVNLSRGEAALRLDIANVGSRQGKRRPSAPGYGLIGIRERVASVDGTLTTGPTPDGGFQVSARIPLPARLA